MENTNVVTEEVKNEVERPVVETVAVTEKKGLIQAVKDKNKRFVEDHPVATRRIKKGLEIGKDVLFFGLGVATVVGITKAINGDNSENPEAESDENIIEGEFTVTETEQETEADASENVVEF